MDKSIFTDKMSKPGDDDLRDKLGDAFHLWHKIIGYLFSKYPYSLNEWNYPGEKYGWSFRIKDKKRAILYLLPRNGYFKTAFVFGQKATDVIMKSDISDTIKSELQSAKVYAEGRGIRIDVKDDKILDDIKKLIDIKLVT